MNIYKYGTSLDFLFRRPWSSPMGTSNGRSTPTRAGGALAQLAQSSRANCWVWRNSFRARGEAAGFFPFFLFFKGCINVGPSLHPFIFKGCINVGPSLHTLFFKGCINIGPSLHTLFSNGALMLDPLYTLCFSKGALMLDPLYTHVLCFFQGCNHVGPSLHTCFFFF